MKRSKLIAKIVEANAKANEYRREADQSNDTKTMFLALGYRMEAQRLMKKVA